MLMTCVYVVLCCIRRMKAITRNTRDREQSPGSVSIKDRTTRRLDSASLRAASLDPSAMGMIKVMPKSRR
jgi:hypothetical protein